MAGVPLQPRGSVPPCFAGFSLGSVLLVNHVTPHATRRLAGTHRILLNRRSNAPPSHSTSARKQGLRTTRRRVENDATPQLLPRNYCCETCVYAVVRPP